MCYIQIIALAWLATSLANSKLDTGYLCYVISDLIIGFELAFKQIYPRQLRILVVPMLYWLGQYLTIQHLALSNSP